MVFVRTDKPNKTNQLHGDNFVTMQLFLLKTDPMNGSCITHLFFINKMYKQYVYIVNKQYVLCRSIKHYG